MSNNIRRIRGFGGNYFVSDGGEVIRNGMSIRGALNNKGYRMVTLSFRGKTKCVTVHSLVADCFLGKRPKGAQVNHINGNKCDNRVSNLEWCNASQNQRHRIYELKTKHSMPPKPVVSVSPENGEILNIYQSMQQAGRESGVSASCISYNVSGKTNTAGGVRWEAIR